MGCLHWVGNRHRDWSWSGLGRVINRSGQEDWYRRLASLRWRGCEVAPPHLHSVSERLIVEARVAVLWRQPLNRKRAHSFGLEHFALDHDPGNSYAIEDVLGKPYAILFAEHKINLSSLIPNE
jgi:hypothetical protein